MYLSKIFISLHMELTSKCSIFFSFFYLVKIFLWGVFREIKKKKVEKIFWAVNDGRLLEEAKESKLIWYNRSNKQNSRLKNWHVNVLGVLERRKWQRKQISKKKSGRDSKVNPGKSEPLSKAEFINIDWLQEGSL